METEQEHATKRTVCERCGADQLSGLVRQGGIWLCPDCSPKSQASNCRWGCTRADAYRHTTQEGFTCKHGAKV